MHLKQSFWRVVPVTLLIAGLGVLMTARADDDDEERPASPTSQPAQMQRGARPGGREGVLHTGMEDMGRSFKKLQAQVADSSKNESTLTLVSQLQTLTVTCKADVPRLVQRMPATQQAGATSDYRMMMVSLLRMEADLEEQLLNSDNKKAAETVKEMDKLQTDGHKDFRPQRKGGQRPGN